MELLKNEIQESINTLQEECKEIEDREFRSIIQSQILFASDWIDQVEEVIEIEEGLPTPFDFARIKLKRSYLQLVEVNEKLFKLINLRSMRRYEVPLTLVVDNTRKDEA
jgi:hypothetical protein